MPLLCTITNAAVLVYGGVSDYKKREIPNLVPVVLLATGTLYLENILLRFLFMLFVGFILWSAAKWKKSELPGGDVKLLCSLAFSVGPVHWTLTFVFTSLCIIIWSLLRKLSLKRSVPLCSYVACAFIILSPFATQIKHGLLPGLVL